MSEFTFAVMGHNEADRLHVALGQALEAAGPGDRVWFVDSASTDDSAVRATALGAEVVGAPFGKGRAMTFAFERCPTRYICFVDGDLESSEVNVPAALRDCVVATDADMVVGSYFETQRRRLVTPGLYLPLVSALFSEELAGAVERPLSGQRALRCRYPLGRVPPGYGVETHLNVHVQLLDGVLVNCPLGRFDSPLREYTTLLPVAVDVVTAIFDLAEEWGRLAPARRAEWEQWVEGVLAVIKRQTTGQEPGIVEELDVVVARPFPSRT